MAIEKLYQSEIVLDFPIDVVSRSFSDIKRMHKWNAAVYFAEDVPGDIECDFYTVVDGHDTILHTYVRLMVTRSNSFVSDLQEEFPIISIGSRKKGSEFLHTGKNILRLELTRDDEYPATKTKVVLTRHVFFWDDPERDIELRTRHNKSTDITFNGLKSLVIDEDGLLSIPDKPLQPPL